MIALRLLATVAAALLAFGNPPQDPAAARAPAFRVLDVVVDTGAIPLAAWQLEVTVEGAALVGVEGGEPTAFRDAPRYDPKALQGDRIVLAALAAGDELPRGKLRVARLHVTTDGSREPLTPVLRSAVTADAEGRRFEAHLEFQASGEGR